MITQSAQNAKSLPPCRNLALVSTIFAAIFEIMHKLTIKIQNDYGTNN